MKIAMFTDAYRPQINGAVSSIVSFTKQLRSKGNRVFIFAPSVPNTKKERFVYRFASIPFTAYKEYRIGVPYQMLTDKKLKKMDFDVIHVHSPFSIGALGLGIARHYDIPAVGTFHTLFPNYMHYFIRQRYLQKLKEINLIFDRFAWKYLVWFYNQCDEVIAPSETIKKILIIKGIRKKISVIPTGISLDKKKSGRKKAGNEKIILHVGRITKEKNITFIINALKDILDDVKLVIASDGPYIKDLQGHIDSLGLSSRIKFTGYLPPTKLDNLYDTADVLVMASESETQGLVLAEAASHGLPMVVLKSPVIGDFVREHDVGIVSDKEDFGKSVRKMLYDQTLRKKAIRNCKQTSNKYDIKKCAESLLSAYERVIAEVH